MALSKARPPKLQGSAVQRQIVQDIYKELNNIIDAVNSEDVVEAKDESKGKPGNIRVIKSPENGAAHIEIKLEDGWYRSDGSSASGFSYKEEML